VAARRKSREAEIGISQDREPAVGPSTLALTELADGETGRILRLTGSGSVVGRLKALGLLAGTVIAKKSAALHRGPVVIERGGSQLALAYAIAKSILVEPLRRPGGR
jgi:Fe2+ transport system protein FeoA